MKADSEGLGGQPGRGRDFMESLVAVCAIMACADGDVRPSECRSISSYIATEPTLEDLDADAVNQLLEDYVRAIQDEGQSAKIKLSGKIMQFCGNKPRALALMQFAYRVMISDHDIHEQERKEFRRLCLSLNLDPDVIFGNLSAATKRPF